MPSAQPKKKSVSLDREALVKKYLPHVKRIVHRMAVHLPAHVEIDDLIHVGVIGLIQAIDRFDASRDNTFLTYAVFRIRGAVLSELRSRDFLSRSSRKKVRDLDETFHRLEQQLGRTPDEEDMAEAMGISLDEYFQIRRMASISFVSFEELGIGAEEDRSSIVNSLVNNTSNDALSLTRIKELKEAIAEAIEQLPEKEKLVVSLYYVDELTMKEAGHVLNITESRVSQIHSQALSRLRTRLRKQGLV